MKTSATQFAMLVNFAEQYGDINTPSKIAHGRIQSIQHWDRLKALLNADPTGDIKTFEKWKKICKLWSKFWKLGILQFLLKLLSLKKIAVTIAIYMVVVMLLMNMSLDSFSSSKKDNANIDNGTELVFALMVHRHGDRTPVEYTLLFTEPCEREEALKSMQGIGYGQLTKRGLQRSYRLGKYIRRRYNSLLSPKFKHTELYLRSTDVDRCKMTCLIAMSAVYPSGIDNWSQHVNWQPVPYTTVPVDHDFLFSVCPKQRSSESLTPNINETLSNQIKTMAQIAIVEPAFIKADVYRALESMEIKLENETIVNLPEYYRTADNIVREEMAARDKESIFGLSAGVLLNEFVDNAEAIIEGISTQRVRIYSAHDIQVYWLQWAAGVPLQGVPNYCALFALELRRVVATGKYVVFAVYLPSPDESEYPLTIEGCGELCYFDTFKNLTASHRLVQADMKETCGSL